MMADTFDGLGPAEPVKKSRGRAGLLMGLLLGGIAGGLGPTLLRPYLPGFLAGSGGGLSGVVESTRIEPGHMLLTLTTPEGSILATFEKDAAGVGLLVGVGDSMTLDLRRYAPFVKDPKITRVKKPEGRLGEGGEAGIARPTGAEDSADSGAPEGPTAASATGTASDSNVSAEEAASAEAPGKAPREAVADSAPTARDSIP